MEYTHKDKRIYLRLGDRVTHLWHEEWGSGAVVEERTSVVPGGTCLVRLLWQDGQVRTFNNDLDHEQCCFFFGVRRIDAIDFEARPPAQRPEPWRRIVEPKSPGGLMALPPAASEAKPTASSATATRAEVKPRRRRPRAIEVQVITPSRPKAPPRRTAKASRTVVDVTPSRPRARLALDVAEPAPSRARRGKPGASKPR